MSTKRKGKNKVGLPGYKRISVSKSLKASREVLIWSMVGGFLLTLLLISTYWRWLLPVFSSRLPLSEKVQETVYLLTFFVKLDGLWLFALRFTNVTFLTVNIYLLFKYFAKYGFVYKQGSLLTTFGAITTALFSGCFGCAVSLFYPLISFLGLGTLATVMPYGGREFLLVSLLLLAASMFYIRRLYKKGVSC